MATVIDYNIDHRDLRLDVFPEAPICLVAHKNLRPSIFIYSAGSLYVHPVDITMLTEVLPPHFEASTAIYSYFKDVYLSPYELTKVMVIDIEIVNPLPDASTLCARIKIQPERI